jgi:hypothetical protein
MTPDEDVKKTEGQRGRMGEGDLSFLLFRHCEERSDVAISNWIIFIHSGIFRIDLIKCTN